MSLPENFFGNENWKLVLRPIWIRKNKETVDVPCVSCRDLEDCVGLGCGTGPCNYCNGTGFVKALKVIDSPLPLNDPKYSRFFNSLQEV